MEGSATIIYVVVRKQYWSSLTQDDVLLLSRLMASLFFRYGAVSI